MFTLPNPTEHFKMAAKLMNSRVFFPVYNPRNKTWVYDIGQYCYVEVEHNQAIKCKQLSTLKSFGIIYV